MDLRDIVPWSLIWGAQNQCHKQELDIIVLLGLTPNDTEWVKACEVAAKLLPSQHYNPDAIELEGKPSEAFLAGMRKAGLLVAEIIFDEADPKAYVKTVGDDDEDITVYRPSLYRVACDLLSMEYLNHHPYVPPHLSPQVRYL